LSDPRRVQKGAIVVKGATIDSQHKNSPKKWFKERDNGISITSVKGRILNLSAPRWVLRITLVVVVMVVVVVVVVIEAVVAGGGGGGGDGDGCGCVCGGCGSGRGSG
jgi:hypothetical protein